MPYRLHTVLTDNGIQFNDLPRNRHGWTARYRVHRLDQICRANGIEHHLTKPNHPWPNGQVERTNRTIKEATVNRYHYETHDQTPSALGRLRNGLQLRPSVQNAKGRTPYEAVCKVWTTEPHCFISNPIHQSPGLNTISTPIAAITLL
jgi:transposase InsO family protein